MTTIATKILTESMVVEPFVDRVEILADELEFAIEYDISTILLAVYKSEFMRGDVEAVLAERLKPLGQQIKHIPINSETHDLPMYLRWRDDTETSVYSVSGIRLGGGRDDRNTYRALNIRREYFGTYRIRVIFWLTESEVFNLPRYAPDFWAFRNRTVEFMDAPQPRHLQQQAKEVALQEENNAGKVKDAAFLKKNAAKIAYREELLIELPHEPERMFARMSVLQTLAELYAAQGDDEKADIARDKAAIIKSSFAKPT